MVITKKHKITLLICLLYFIGAKNLHCQTNKIFSNTATFYHDKFENHRTSSGDVFKQNLFTAAHHSLPLNTIVKVTNKNTGKSVLVKINDRCPRRGIIDLTKSAFKRLGLRGNTQTNIEVLGKEYLDIWKIQDSLINRTELSYEEQVFHLDSLINDKKLNKDAIFYVRLATAEGKNEAKSILNSIPSKYISLAKTEKIYNENFYYVNIGPFINKEKANIAINELKKEYPLSHLVKKLSK